mgnify:CR=1 FL=1
MKSITFRGHDLSPYCTAETTLKPLAVSEPKTRTVPGRPGALLVGGSMPPVEIKVKLMMRADRRMDASELAGVRHTLAGWLGGTVGGELVLPEEPGLSYRDCVVTKVRAWDALFEDGCCEVTFTAHDPVAYGELRHVTSSTFDVGGTWVTKPVLTVITKPSNTFLVTLDGERELRLLTSTKTGDIYVFDCSNNRLTVNGEVADERVAVGSDFFSLEPGSHSLSLRNCTLDSIDFHERWL